MYILFGTANKNYILCAFNLESAVKALLLNLIEYVMFYTPENSSKAVKSFTVSHTGHNNVGLFFL